MSTIIYTDVLAKNVINRVPPIFKAQLELRNFKKETGFYTVLVFSSQDKSPVISSIVKRELLLVPSHTKVIAFAGTFTMEAISLLKQHAVEFFTLSDGTWTDSSFQEIRSFIASPVKFPNL